MKSSDRANMFANSWKVILIVGASYAVAEPSRALTLYQKPRTYPMFIPKTRRKFSRILFLDEQENRQALGLGEIDLTKKYDSKIKFDDSTDYEFTSPGHEEPLNIDGNDRFYELQRLRPFPKFYQGRFGRPYAPSFAFDPYQAYAPPRTGFYGPSVLNSGWKARSPRVVFPYAPDSGSNSVNSVSSVNTVSSVQTNSHGGPNFNDNVVFRDQTSVSSGNDVGAEEQGLQDISSGADAFTERDAYDPHRARNEIKSNGHIINKYHHYKLKKPMFIQTEVFIKRNAYEYPNATHESVLPEFKPITDAQMKKINEIIKELSTNKRNSTNGKRKGRVLETVQVPETPQIEPTKIYDNDKKDVDSNCSQGGTCEFFFYCWMVGGLLDGSCGSLLKGCCHRLAKAGLLGVQDSNSIEYTPNEGISYGPVINDESKC